MAVPSNLISPQTAQMDKIKATHLDDISTKVDVSPLLLIVENIFDPKMQEDVTHAAVQSELSLLIDRVSCEIGCKSLSKADSETTVLTIFNMIGAYDWDVKLVLSLAAFALNYGSFLLINKYSTDELAESIAKLRGLPNLSGNETLSRLIAAMVNLAKCVLEFQRLPRVYIGPKFQAFANALEQIKFAAYLTVKSIVTCSVYISSITSSLATQSTVLSHGFQCMDADLSGYTQQLITTYETLNQHLVDCNSHIVTNKNDDLFYQQLVMYFEKTTQSYTTTTLLTNLLCANDTDRRPLDLIHCSSSVSTATTISINELNLVKKYVLMFFSSVEISKAEITNIISVYEKHKAACEIVWIPIVEQWTEAAVRKFNKLQALMSWYTISKPKSLHTVVVNFVKNKWQFGSKPMLVVLDPKGKLSCSDAFHMVQIWGADAFPFTSSNQKKLWRQQTWKLDILIQSVQTSESIIWDWITNQKLIFLFGGNNINEVKEIIQSEVRTKHEFMVVCISNSFTEEFRSKYEKQDGYCLIEEEQCQLFNLRLESMLFSKIQVGDPAETDTILFGILKLLSYSKTTEWAMLSQGSEIKVCGLGSLVKQTFHEFSQWQEQATHDFAAAFVGHYQKLSKVKLPPSHFEFPPRGPYIPSQLLCSECNAVMKISATFSCDHPKYHVTSTSITNMTKGDTTGIGSATSVHSSSAAATNIQTSGHTNAGVTGAGVDDTSNPAN